MMKKQLLPLLTFTLFLAFTSSSCRKDPYTPDYDHAGGTVIGKETCSADTTNDYWLIDLNVDYTSNNTFGDTLTVAGIKYNHLAKTKQLIPEFKVIGKRVSFDCHFSALQVTTTGCTVSSPQIYYLKEMIVIASGEIR